RRAGARGGRRAGADDRAVPTRRRPQGSVVSHHRRRGGPVVDGQLVPMTERRQGTERPLSGKALAELAALCQLREATVALLADEADHTRPDTELDPGAAAPQRPVRG